MFDMRSDEKVREDAREVLQLIYAMEDALDEIVPVLEDLIEGEISVAEYREWIENNEDLIGRLDYL